MDLPITRPSRISYADELNFSELLGELKSKKYNGFIRVTSDSEEGYILFKGGKQVAASYEKYSKMDAIKKIKSTTKNNNNTLIEVFELKESQIKYIIDINKVYLITSGPEVYNKLDELKKAEIEVKNEIKYHSDEEEISEIKETVEVETDVPAKLKESESENTGNVRYEVQSMSETQVKSNMDENAQQEAGIKAVPEDISPGTTDEESEPEEHKISTSTAEKSEEIVEPEIEPEVEPEPIDRAELMKKYGLKEVAEEEVENILESYKGGSISDDDVEKIELTLMNKIKKSILSIPKIKGTEVMVFLDNIGELTGDINIITEYESKGFLSRIIGDSNDLDNLKRQIINITQIEIRKSFRGFPEIVDNFKINVEVS